MFVDKLLILSDGMYYVWISLYILYIKTYF